jgi:RNA polymerase sigma-B factor
MILLVPVASYRHVEPDSERLVRRHLPLVRSLASRHAGRGESLDDLVQVASLALVTAARRFDPDRGVPFAAYAAPTIDGELRHYLRDRTGAVRIPRREQQAAVRISQALGAISQRLGREASLPEAADAASVAVGEARRALESRRAPTPWTELEACASAEAEEEIDACEVRALVQAGLRHLDAREREAVGLRFVADLPQTEIGRRMDISQSQASRILAGALEKLRLELGPELDQAA